jgi:group I intron endonuclease
MGYIYKITNKSNEKIYIGLTTKERPTDRFSQHRYLATHPEQEKNVSYLHRAMRVEGVDNFSFDIIEVVDNKNLYEREKYWIKYYNSLSPNGYNLTEGGEGTQGFIRPQPAEEKQKKSETMKQYYINHPEKRQEIAERAKELWQNEEYRNKVTESNKKFYQEHPNLFKGENNPMYGKKHTEEALEKIRAHAATRKQKIAQLDKDNLEIIQVFDGIKDAEKALNVSHGWLSKAARNDKVAYGFRWKFL